MKKARKMMSMRYLENLFKKYASEKFLVSVFYSGSRELFKNTEELILHNKLCGAD